MLIKTFGLGFANQYGDTPNEMWLGAFGGFTDAEIKKGMENLQGDGLSFPPNLSQFQSACRRWSGHRVQPNVPQVEDQTQKTFYQRLLAQYTELYVLKNPGDEQRAEMRRLWKQIRS